MALTEAGSLFSWGLANHGQLGIAKFLDKNFVSTPVRIDQRTYEISGLQSVNIEDITSASDKSFIVVNHHRKNHLTLFESSEADQPEDVEADEIDEKEESKEETPSTITAGQTTEWGGTDYEDLVQFIAMSGSGRDPPIDRELLSQLSLTGSQMAYTASTQVATRNTVVKSSKPPHNVSVGVMTGLLSR